MHLPIPARTYAILVDGDNASPAALAQAVSEVERQGGVAWVRLVFGNAESLKKMREASHAHAFRPVLQHAIVARKNTTDVAMAIAAMDLLHEGQMGAFCLVSSDSDFQPLAIRLREAGRHVLGIGNAAAPAPLRAAFDRFVEVAAEAAAPPKDPPAPKPASPPAAPAKATAAPAPAKAASKPPPPQKPPIKDLPRLRSLFTEAFHAVRGKTHEVELATLGQKVRELDPAFKVKDYGRNQFIKLVEDCGTFHVTPLDAGTTSGPRLVRLRP